MRHPVLLAFVSMAIATTPALAQDAVAPAPSPATAVSAPTQSIAAKPVKERRICRRDAALGSNIPHSTCHMASEWAQVDAAERGAAQATIATARQSGR